MATQAESRYTRIGAIAKVFAAALTSSPILAAAPGEAHAQDAPTMMQKPSTLSAEARRREEWRTTIRRTPLPGAGCFKAAYPATIWTQVPCGKAPSGPAAPAQKIHPLVVGDTNDDSAESGGVISSAEGSFDSVTGVTGEKDSGANNNYSLQLNSNHFKTTFCSGSSNPNCLGWQQFMFNNNPDSINVNTNCSVIGGACAFMQYWLLDYGSSCPSGWTSDSGGCRQNSGDAVSVDRQEIGDLGRLTLTGQAGGGSDSVILVTSDDQAHALSAPSVLSLNQSWQAAEFNVFGNCCLTEAGFNIGSIITVRTSINDGTTNPPLCNNVGTTGETNNLTIVSPCTASGGASPAIVFTESFLGPAAALQPLFVSDFHDQQHFTYLAASGAVFDAYSCPDCDDAPWRLQQISGQGSLTGAPVAVAAPSVGVYTAHDQQHFAYLAANGAIVDAYDCPQCDGSQWRVQQINLGGSGTTNGPAALSSPSIDEYVGHDQQHFAYLAANGEIWDAYYCPQCSGATWRVQQINGQGGLTDAPPALTQPVVSTYYGHDQQHFVYLAANGEIWDAFYCPQCSGNPWKKQRINLGSPGMTDAPAAVSAPFVNVYLEADQQHFAYLAANGEIWDAFYCPKCSGNAWRSQRINLGGVTDGLAATSQPFVSEYLAALPASGVHNQQHFAYTTKGGDIEDAYYCAECGGGQWKLQQITAGSGSVTSGPPAYFSLSPFVNVDAGHDQQHFAYVTASGGIWDAYYCAQCGSKGEWKLQQIAAAVTP